MVINFKISSRKKLSVYVEVFVYTSRPGFGQDRVNSHQKPGADTARPSDPNRSNKWDIPYHVLSCSVPGGGASWGQGSLGSGTRELTGHQAVRVAPCILLFVLYILSVGIVVTVCFLCCSVKLLLSRLTSFCLFLSILIPTPAGGRGNRAMAWPFVVSQGQTTIPLHTERHRNTENRF